MADTNTPSLGAGFYGDGTLLKGQQGNPGKDGAQGPAGPTGPQGPGPTTSQLNEAASVALALNPPPKGDKGDKGEAATITVAGVSTANPGSPAVVTNVGDSTHASFAFTIPQGPKGDTGIQGPQGMKGDKGDKGDSQDALTLQGYSAEAFARLASSPTFQGTVRATDGTGLATMQSNGDIFANRGNGQGVIYLGDGSKYLFFDGSNYRMPGGGLYVNDGWVLTTTNSDFLPKAGGTMTGDLVSSANIRFPSINTAERQIQFAASGGRTTYLYGNSGGVGLYDTTAGSVWAYSTADGINTFNIKNGRAIFPDVGNIDFFSQTGAAYLNGHRMMTDLGGDFVGTIGVAGDVWINNGGDLILTAQVSGGTSRFYNDNGGIALKTGDNERILVDAAGTTHVKGQRPMDNGATIGGSGNLRVFTNTATGYALSTYDYYNYWAVQFVRAVNGSDQQVGSIYCTDGGTSFNTASDYRLKMEIRPVTSASARVMLLKPCNFAWIASGKRVDGFIAHELAEVIPEAVTGEKDAVEAIGTATPPTPAEGEAAQEPITSIVQGLAPEGWTWVQTGTRPVYQGIDQAKLVPLLTAALQEALSRLTALEADVAALKAA